MKIVILSALLGMDLMALMIMVGRFVKKVYEEYKRVNEYPEWERCRVIDISTGEIVEEYEIRVGF